MSVTSRPPRSAKPLASRESVTAAANSAMERYAEGDESAFDELYDLLTPPLHRALLARIRDPERAEDLVQQTMLQIHLTRGRFERGANVLPWAFALARRKLIDDCRSERRRPSVVALPEDEECGAATSSAAEEEVDAARMWGSVEAALQRMPEDQRVAFALVRQEGLPVREAAARLGITANALKLRAHRAYEALRTALRFQRNPRCHRSI